MKQLIQKDSSLLEALPLLGPDSSKTTLRSWLKQGRILVSGKVVRQANFLVKPGDEISLLARKQFAHEGIEILYEDKDLVVIYKPEGLLSVATKFDSTYTAHAVMKQRKEGIVYPVHRLDRETSGIMMMAYSEKAREGLKKQFQEHTIAREYVAIVEGEIKENGTWQSYLKEEEDYRVHSADGGKLSTTHYTILKKLRSFTVLKLKLETGRKNQIRVHCKEAGHPIVGDQKYGATTNPIGRLGLHAKHLGFIHPITQKRLSFDSELPESFTKLQGF